MVEKKRTKERDLFEQVGVSGLNEQAGYIFDDFLPQLRLSKRMQTLKEMRYNDATIGGISYAIQLLGGRARWEAKAEKSDTPDIEARDFIQSVMDDMASSWGRFVSEALSMTTYGFDLHEIVLKIRRGQTDDPKTSSKFDDGMVGIGKLAVRSQETIDRWIFGDHGALLGAHQLAPPVFKGTFIPIHKLLHIKLMTNNENPEGYPLWRNAYRAWFIKKRIENLEAIGVERDLAGIPIPRLPLSFMTADATPAEKQTYEDMKRMGRDLRNDEQSTVVIPSDRDEKGHFLFDLTLLSSPGKRQFPTNEIINRYDSRIAMVALADFFMIGHEKGGSFALHSDKTKLFGLSVGSLLDIIAQGFNDQLIPLLLKMNPSLNPTGRIFIDHGDIEDQDLASLGEYIKSLTVSGIDLTDEPTEDHLREAAHLPSVVQADE